MKPSLYKTAEKRICDMPKQTLNILSLLANRRNGQWGQSSLSSDLQKLAEDKAVSSEMQEVHCKLPSSARSTFLMAFSPDSTKVASTHGDHKIYVCDVQTGKLLHKLEGHPRTPWCLAFHPSSNDILASGCLGGEVRVWDLHGGSEKWEADQNTVITSLTFHPLDKVLVIATYNQIHFWDWSLPKPFATCKTSSEREKVRFVKFDRLGYRLITGITNLVPESSRSGVTDSHASQNSWRSLSSNTFYSHRRSILSRLISMYRQMEGLEELTRYQESLPRPNSPTQEDALNQAREYAAITTGSSFSQRLYNIEQALPVDENANSNITENANSNTTSPIFDPENPNVQEYYIPDLNESSNNFATRYFWATFQRLRFICTSLEQRLPPIRRNTESRADGQASSSSNSHSQNSSADLGLNPNRLGNEPSMNNNNGNASNDSPHVSQHRASVSLINLLTRLQSALQNAVLSNAHAQGQIQQLQLRICEILERLTSVTGYRARLNSLRAQIYEERAMRRGGETSTIQRWDLAHCLWLVEMSLELTRQMHRILQADIRLTRLHFASPTLDGPDNNNNGPGPSSEGSSENSPSIAAALNLVSNLPQTSQPDPDPMLYSSLVSHTSVPVPQSNAVASAIADLDARCRDTRSHINCSRADYVPHHHSPIPADRFNDIASSDIYRTLFGDDPTDSSSRGENSNSSSDLGGWHSDFSSEINDNSLSAPSTSGVSFQSRSSLEPLDSSLNESNEQLYEDHDHYTLPRRRHNTELLEPPRRQRRLNASEGIIPLRIPFTAPDIPDVQIEPSPPTSSDSEPLPVHERPRSPPLSTILYGAEPGPSTWGRVPPYFSTVYDGSFPPRLGNQEPLNFTHRIQAWDFSNFQLPTLSDVNSNIVVRKCKIHNDASVDISKDGKILVALVPSNPLSNALILSVHSLQPKTLGQCLYSMPFESNAISVSLSPLGRFVVVGLASPRLYFASNEKEAVARILKLESDGKLNAPKHVRSLTQQVFDGIYHPQVSLNSVRWLPHSGQGLIYGTNRGCLCICKPVSPMSYKKGKILRINRVLSHYNNLTLGLQPRVRNRLLVQRAQQMSASTQTTETETQTTGTQTFNANGL